MEDNDSQRNCQNQLRDLSLSHITRMPGEFDSRKDSHPTKLEQIPKTILAKLYKQNHILASCMVQSYLTSMFLRIWPFH